MSTEMMIVAGEEHIIIKRLLIDNANLRERLLA